jgi:hypothetical protein
MTTNMVTWSDYEGIEGFGGVHSHQDVDALNKALNVGADRDPPSTVTAGDGFAMRVESLENTMRILTNRMEHLTFFRALPKGPEYNTVSEYNLLHDYGDNDDDGWISEGDLPNEDSATWERKHKFVKFMGVTRSVSHVATAIRPAHGPLIGQETVNGTMKLLRMLEKALFKGDSNLSSLQFDGFERQMIDGAPSGNIIDMRGKPLNESVLIDAALSASDAPNYGLLSDLFCSPKTKADLLKSFFPKGRYDLGSNPSNDSIGMDVKKFTSPSGDVRFNTNVFINDGGGVPSAAVGDTAKIPATPTVSTGATTPVDATASFAADDAGNYYYSVVAVNRYGHSAAVSFGTVAVAAGDKCTFGVTPGSAVSVDYYRIYRTKVGGASGTQRLILRVANAAGAGEQTINDKNEWLPATTSAYAFQMDGDTMKWKQLTPMVRIPLATIDTSIRWAQVIYGTPILYAPQRTILFKNIGRADGYVGQP